MTGFGRSELKFPHGIIRVEIKTINHKFLEISSRLPAHLADFEESIRKMISQELGRGKVTLFVSCPDPAVFSTRLLLNETLATEVFHKIQRLGKILRLDGAEKGVLGEVLRYPDVLTRDVSTYRRNEFSKILGRVVASAIRNLHQSRLSEGSALQKDFRQRVREILRSIKIIEKRLPALVREYRRTLEGKLREFLKNDQIDRERLTVEVAQYVKNSDISEELTRLKSHLVSMERALKEPGELGRKIDFMGQEMTREANTLGAKSSDITIARRVIDIKGAIEKIREQAQNVE